MTIQVTIRGAGVFGLACAWAMARRGAGVRVVDPAGVGAGASGGVVGALAPHAPEGWDESKAFQLRSLLMAGDWWREVAAAGGVDPGYARTGRLQPIPDEAALARARARGEMAAALWGGAADWRVEPAPPGWSPATPLVIRDTLSARIDPRRACAALAAAIAARGGAFATGAADAGVVLHATGWRGLETMHAADGVPAGRGVRGQALRLRLDRGRAPQLYVDALHIVPHADGTTAIGSTTEPGAEDGPPDGQADVLLARAVAAVPALRGADVLERWAGMRPRAWTRRLLLGAWPMRAGHFVANGGFKIGFGMAPLAAETMADLILDGHDAIPSTFRADGLARWCPDA